MAVHADQSALAQHGCNGKDIPAVRTSTQMLGISAVTPTECEDVQHALHTACVACVPSFSNKVPERP